MTLKQWSKRNKKTLAVILVIVFILMWAGGLETQSTFTPQSTCDGNHFESSCNNDGCYWAEEGTSTDGMVIRATAIAGSFGAGCIAGFGFSGGIAPVSIITTPIGCTIGFYAGATGTNLISEIVSWFRSDCFSCLPDGYVTSDRNSCCSGRSTNIEVESITGVDLLARTNYVCFTPEPGESCGEGFIGGLGELILDTGLDKYIQDCNLAGFIGIGLIGFLALFALSFLR